MTDVFPPELWESGALRGPSSNTILIYLSLRYIHVHSGGGPAADILGDKLGLSPTRVRACIGELKRLGWIGSDGKLLPTPFTEKKPRECHAIDDIAADLKRKNRLVGETNAILTNQTAKEICPRNRKSNSPRVLQYFKSKYWERVGKTYGYNHIRAMTMCKRLQTWADGDLDRVFAMIDFAFTNWDRLRKDWGVEGEPSLNFFATGTWWQRLSGAMKHGLGSSLLNRYIEDDSPEAGFDE